MAAKKKTAPKKGAARVAPKTKRYASQVAAEAAREATDKYGKTLVRHDADSRAAMRRMEKRWDCSGPEALRKAIVQADERGNR